jgi:hypothetical protein
MVGRSARSPCAKRRISGATKTPLARVIQSDRRSLCRLLTSSRNSLPARRRSPKAERGDESRQADAFRPRPVLRRAERAARTLGGRMDAFSWRIAKHDDLPRRRCRCQMTLAKRQPCGAPQAQSPYSPAQPIREHGLVRCGSRPAIVVSGESGTGRCFDASAAQRVPGTSSRTASAARSCG